MTLQDVALALADARDAMLAALLAAERDDFEATAEALERAGGILAEAEAGLRAAA